MLMTQFGNPHKNSRFQIEINLKIGELTELHTFTGNAPQGVNVDKWTTMIEEYAKTAAERNEITEHTRPLKSIHDALLKRFRSHALKSMSPERRLDHMQSRETPEEYRPQFTVRLG